MGKSRSHYVPRFVLRRFCIDSQDAVHVYDKHAGKSFVAGTSKVAAEKGLYDFEFEGADLTLEPSLAEIEGAAALHFEEIVKHGHLHPSNPAERHDLSRFFAVQLVRTPAHREMWQDLTDRMEAWLRREGMQEDFFAVDPLLGSQENAERAFAISAVMEAPQTFGPALARKDFVLMETDGSHSYLMGDHPLVMHNSRNHGPQGNLGLDVEGVEIYFPLSRRLTLGIMCQSHRVAFQRGLERASESQLHDPGLRKAFAIARDFLNAVESGQPTQMDPENVKFLNSLQVIGAERFLFSADGDFSLAEEMLSDHPGLRRGRRIEEATGKF